MLKQVIMGTAIALVGANAVSAQATFHGNNARTGVYDSAGPKEFGGVKWTFKTNGPIVTSPTIADAVVFIGSADGFLYAVDEETGQQKWKFNTNGPMASSPAVANGMVYVKAYNKAFYALAADTGAVRWTFLTEYERRFEAKGLHGYTTRLQTIPDSWDIFLSSPAVSGGKVIFGSGDGNVYALDALTGVLQWKFETSDVVHASPAIANNTVYIGSWDSNLYALDADTGQEKWRFKAGEDPVIHNQVGFQSSTAIVGGTLYVGCRDGHVYAIDAATGRKKWDYPTNMGWVPGTPAVRDGVVYVGLSDGARFYALDAKTGRTRYTLSAKANVFSSPALAGDLGYFGVMNGRLEAFDTKTGKIAWEFQTESSKKDALKLLNADGSFNLDTVYGPYFHDYQDMALAIYRVFSLGAIVSSPVIDRGTVYFGSTDGNLYAIH